jgi:hypothetical protein
MDYSLRRYIKKADEQWYLTECFCSSIRAVSHIVAQTVVI